MSTNEHRAMSSCIWVPDMCRAHQAELVQRLRIPESGPWRVAIIVTQIRLFQTATACDRVWQRCGLTESGERDVADLSLVLAEIGCLACFDRSAFQETVDLIRTHGLSHVAQLSHDPTRFRTDLG